MTWSAVLVALPEAHYLLPYLHQATCFVLVVSCPDARHHSSLHWRTRTVYCCHAQPVVAACHILQIGCQPLPQQT